MREKANTLLVPDEEWMLKINNEVEMNEIADDLGARLEAIDELLGQLQDEFHGFMNEIHPSARLQAGIVNQIGQGRGWEQIQSHERLRHLLSWRRILHALFNNPLMEPKRIEWMTKVALIQCLASFQQ